MSIVIQRSVSVAILCLMLLLLIQGCVGVEPYQTTAYGNADGLDHKRVPAEAIPKEDCISASPCVLFAEYDGFGRMFNRSQLSQIVQSADTVAASQGLVVVYVHGWKHNAKSDDENLKKFRELLENAKAVQQNTTKIMGVFVGWPGDSVTVEPFRTLSFWERKNTAHSVGNGDIFELFMQLSRIRQQYPGSHLVIVGHSFGGAVTYTALANKLTDQILQDPAPGDSGPQLPPLWDLAVLVNPAFEAMRVRAQMDVARSRNYQKTQIPHLVLVTTDADAATRVAFKAGRFFSTFFDSYSADDVNGQALNNTAIGHYIPYVTHQLSVAKPEDCSSTKTDAAVLKDDARLNGAKDRTCFKDPAVLSKFKDAQPLQLVRCDARTSCNAVAAGHFIEKGDAGQGYVPLNFPIMNIRTTGDVMNGHSDIWNDTMHSFLTQLVVRLIKDPGGVPFVPFVPLVPLFKIQDK